MAELQRLLLVVAGIRMSHRSVLALAWVSDAVSASLPVGAPAAGAYTFRYFTRRGASPGVAGWVMVASGLMSTTALAGCGRMRPEWARPDSAAVGVTPGGRRGAVRLGRTAEAGCAWACGQAGAVSRAVMRSRL
jgi:hypothetical protein